MKTGSEKILFFLCLLVLPGIPARSQYPAHYDSVFTQYFRRTCCGWTAGDATISVPLPDHRVIWLFGDSYIVPVDTTNNSLPCLFQIRNCMMVQDSVNRNYFRTITDSTQTGINRTPFKMVPSDTTLFWPNSGYVWSDTVYLFFDRINNSNMGIFDGEYIIKLHYPDLQQVLPYKKLPANNGIIFGRSVLIDTASDYLYVYGNKLNWIVWEPYIARCDVHNPLGPYEYFTGTGWSVNPALAQKISSDPVSPNFSVIRYNNKYYLITQENGYLTCGLGREIYSYESNNPYGPFINKKLFYTEESMINGSYLLTYNATAHPEFFENGQLLVSYNTNDQVDTTLPNICPSQCLNIWTNRMDADSYRPKFIRVPFDTTAAGLSIKTEPGIISIYPNPATCNSILTIHYQSLMPTVLKLEVTDVAGRIIGQHTFAHSGGAGSFTISAPDKEGLFFITVSSGITGKSIRKFIVVKRSD